MGVSRSIAITIWALLFAASIFSATPSTAAGPVQVEIFENISAGAELNVGDHQPAERYTEPAFGFVSIPTRYSENALPLDRSTPFILRASLDRALPAGDHQFRLRSKGAAWFLVDGKVLLSAQPQKPNQSGDDPVPPPVVPDGSGRRSAVYPHQDVVGTIRIDDATHRFLLVAIIGGQGLVPSPGELSVSFGPPGEVERLLGSESSPRLTDAEWQAYAASTAARHQAMDLSRRRSISAATVAAWDARHKEVREWVQRQPAPEVPEVTPNVAVFNDIDRFVGSRLEAAKIAPMPLTSDLEFLRRVSLDTIGVIPTAEQIQAFLAEPSSMRRKNAIERLLAHAGWADHWVSYWQDVLAENPGILKPDLNNSGPFRWWLHQSFTDNLPLDRFVTELLEMEGSAVQGAPAGFAQATLNDVPTAAKADIVFQAFQAQKLSCARCHDAPFHPFKQKDLFSLAAMLSGKPLKLPATSTVPLVEGGRKPAVEITLKPGDTIEPGWPFEKRFDASEAPGMLPGQCSVLTRHQMAAQIVSPENERFAQVIVNRIWKRYLGVGLVEPVDDWNDAEPSHPELLQYLARELLLSGYDLKHVARLILSSHTYQRKPVAASPEDTGPKSRFFAGPLHRRMSAEQLVDSLHQSVGKSFASEELNLNPAGDRPLRQFLNLGAPKRAWEMTALSNERDRPALALPLAQSIVDVLTTYGWRQSRQNPITTRDDAPSPMQTLILANGILGTRMVRLSDDNAFTELCLQPLPLDGLLQETFLRVLSRPPSESESSLFRDHLRSVYSKREVKDAVKRSSTIESDRRVSWSNHLSAEATLIRLEEERRLRMGDEPTSRLKPEFRERFEDVLWALLNSPEFVLVP
ncbi:MAG TPA: DUF1553 domain-containing protein [Terriglobia bacterium]|nr:DUF1553 domain-containing protein [Terriglobia bacterium]